MSRLQKKLSIGDFCKVCAGGTPDTSKRHYWEGGQIPWMSSGEVHKKRVRETMGFITNEGLLNSSAKIFPRNTILIALAGQGKTRGMVAISEIELSTNQSIAGIISDRSICLPEFLYYNLGNRYQELRSESGGSGRAGLNLSIISNLKINLPPLPEQKKIVEILSGIDKLIAVLVKKEEKNKYLALGVLENIFENNLKIKKLSEMSVLITKGTTPTSVGRIFTEKGINFIKVESIIENGIIDPKKFSFIDHDTHSVLIRSQILSGDILFTIAGTLGKLALAKEEILPANTNQALAIIRVHKEMLRPQFLYHWLKARIIKNIVDKNQTVGAQPNVSLSQIGDFPVPYISLEMQDQIYQRLDSIDQVTSSIRKKIIHLKSLRKSLMSDLLSGRKRVKI